MNKLKKFLHSRAAQNAGWLIGGKCAQIGVNFFISLLTVRYLGPSNFGLLNYAAAYTTFFTAVCTLGIHSVLVKELLDAPEQQGRTMGTALGLRAAASFLSAVMLACLSTIVDAGEPTTIAVVSLSGISLIFNTFELFTYWYQSRLESKVTAIATLIAFTATAIYKAILLILGKSVIWFACATSLDYLLLGVLLMLAYRRSKGQTLSFSMDYAKKLLQKSWHFILPALMISIYSQTDKLMLKQILSETEVGYYSTAVQLCGTWGFVVVAIIDSLTPSIMCASKTDPLRYRRSNLRLYAVVFWLSTAVSLLLTVFAAPIIRILYGAEYLPAVMPLRVITWYTAYSYLGGARNAWIVCENKQKYLFFVYFGAAVANVGLNFLLIPRMGATGAALASLATQIITVFVMPFLVPPLRENSLMMLEGITFRYLRINHSKEERRP